jgi:WD40 repeat protein
MRPFVFPDSPPGAAVSAVAFSPDGSRLLAARAVDAAIWAFDARSARAVAKLAGHRGAISSMVFSPDGSRLASGSLDQTVRIWDAKDYTPLLELLGQNGDIYNLVFSPDGSRLYSAGYGVRTWDTKGRWPCTADDPCCCPNPWPRMATAAGAFREGM